MSNDPGFSEMISAFLEIGRMTRGTVEFQTGLYAAIMQTGKDLKSLTIGELLELGRDFKKSWDQTHNHKKRH
jgi:hypothetical protein